MDINPYVHLLAGGIAGTVGAAITCPLEVIKTRLQSSVATFDFASPTNHLTASNVACINSKAKSFSFGNLMIVKCFRHIIKTEGPGGLFKGLGANLLGVTPTRAIYFYTYSNVKTFCNSLFANPDSSQVYMAAAASAGFVSATITNPLWFIKTRLQLDQRKRSFASTGVYVVNLYKDCGILGFFRGVTASYFGIIETVTYFLFYEFIKNKIHDYRWEKYGSQYESPTLCFIQSMAAGAVSRVIASLSFYPHEVVRTRLRQPDNKYRGFIKTLTRVYHEEGMQSLYRGLGTHLMRQIPNTAIMMGTYEIIVKVLTTSDPVE